MTDKPKTKLAAKVFCASAVIIASCCILTYAVILRYAPYIYQKDPEIALEFAEMAADELELRNFDEASELLTQYQLALWEKMDYEFEIHFFDSDGRELDIYDLDYSIDSTIDDYDNNEYFFAYNIEFDDSKQKYTLLVTENVEKQSQIAVALENAAPVVLCVIAAGSVCAALFITLIIVKPINKLYTISRKMENLDFNVDYKDKRSDEIGVLGRNLAATAKKLSDMLEELKDVNLKLEADIEKERLMERMQNDFFAAASHELKTPITVIKGNLEGMLYNIGRFKDRDAYIKKTLMTTERLQNLLSEILTITKIQTANRFNDFVDINLSAAVKNILYDLKELFEQKELTLYTDIKENIFITSDFNLLNKAVSNLLTNAAVHSQAGGRVFVELYKADDNCILRIQNTAEHIPKEALSRLYEPFYRPDASRSKKTGGTGLGLYIVKRVADMLNAEFRVSGAESEFTAVLIFKL